MTKAPTKKTTPPKKAATASGKPAKSVDDLVSEIAARKGTSASEPGSGAEAQRKGNITKVPTADEKQRMLEQLAERFGTSPEQVEAMLAVQDSKALASVNPAAKPDKPLATPQYKDGDPLVPLKLKSDYWLYPHSHEQWPVQPQLDAEGNPVEGSGNNRATAGTTVHLPIPEAKRLLAAGKAERADPLPGEV